MIVAIAFIAPLGYEIYLFSGSNILVCVCDNGNDSIPYIEHKKKKKKTGGINLRFLAQGEPHWPR